MTLNTQSLTMVRNVFNNFKLSPVYRGYEVTKNENDAHGSATIDVYRSKQPINRFQFFPNHKGNIASVAIYGVSLEGHVNSMKRTNVIFGLPISKIEHITTNTMSPFVDVTVGNY